MAPASSGSLSATPLEKKPGKGPACRMPCWTVMDLTPFLEKPLLSAKS